MKTISALGFASSEVQVIAWGYGRMRPGLVLSVGPKRAKLRLQQNADGRFYEKAVPLDEVFVVPDDLQANAVAGLINQGSLNGHGRRTTVDHARAIGLARSVRGEA